MKLTDELYELGFKMYPKESSLSVDELYVLSIKRMVASDDYLNVFFENIKKAKITGINIASIIDYRLIPNSSYRDENSKKKYSAVMLLMDRVKGNKFELDCLDFDYVLSSNLSYEIDKYLKLINEYIQELEKRANANQDVYDKLVRDCLELTNFELEIDPTPSNYYFDENVGFTITNVVPKMNNIDLKTSKSFVNYIYFIVYGYGAPVIYIDKIFYKKIPQDYLYRLLKCYEEIDEKLTKALKKYGFYKYFIDSIFGELNSKYHRTILDSAEYESIKNDLVQFNKIDLISRKK